MASWTDFASKQEQIDHLKARAAEEYPRKWSSMIADWSQNSSEDRAWLIYSANYLLRTAGVRWAVDPVTLKHRLPNAPEVDAGRDLRLLSFVLLTHRHADHLDYGLLRALKDAPIRWIVPEEIRSLVIRGAHLPESNIIVPKMLESISIHGINIVPFEGLHWEKGPPGAEEGMRGVPSAAYLVEFSGRRWLFPGDTRTYDPRALPEFGAVDGIFAHVWLGRSAAMLEPPPLLDAFCRFYLDLKPRQLVLTHLEEFGREAADFWDEGHAAQVISRGRKLSPEIPIRAAKMGDCVGL